VRKDFQTVSLGSSVNRGSLPSSTSYKVRRQKATKKSHNIVHLAHAKTPHVGNTQSVATKGGADEPRPR
jgi:hypothetical protein